MRVRQVQRVICLRKFLRNPYPESHINTLEIEKVSPKSKFAVYHNNFILFQKIFSITEYL